jgi:ferredoxin/flavodoxin---NADP+ reductase
LAACIDQSAGQGKAMNARLPSEATLPPLAAPKWREQRVVHYWHWTPNIVSFRITRSEDFHFVPGRYARLGLADAAGEIVWRPFSMVSATGDEFLEFLVILMEGGEFSRRLAALKIGGTVLMEKPSFGFLTLDQLAPGETLWMFASGTGLGPFMSVLRDQAPWRTYKHLVLVHSVRHTEELAYRRDIEAIREAHAAIGIGADLRYFPVVTRELEPRTLSARIPQMIVDGRLESAAGIPLESGNSRAMICGNPEMATDMRGLLKARGFATSRRGAPGQMAFEKYW